MIQARSASAMLTVKRSTLHISGEAEILHAAAAALHIAAKRQYFILEFVPDKFQFNASPERKAGMTLFFAEV